MKVIPRSSWTAQYPMSSVGTEDMDGPPWFRDSDVKGIKVSTPGESVLFYELDPYAYLERTRKSDYTQKGYGDISYNLAVSSNVEGVFVLRGLCNKSPNVKDYVSVLCLLGNEEPPTDVLIHNLRACRELVLSKWPNAEDVHWTGNWFDLWGEKNPPESKQFVNQLTNTFTQTDSVHTHELIETLFYWGYYKGRNDGVYGNVTRNAVMNLQADLRDGNFYHKRVDGNYGRYTREAFALYLKTL